MQDDERERLRLELVRKFSIHVPHNKALGMWIEDVRPREATFRPPSGTRVPTGKAGTSEPQPATNATVRSSWKRTISIESTASSRPISSAMAAKTSS